MPSLSVAPAPVASVWLKSHGTPEPETLQETVEDLWHLIARRIREKLTEEENQPSSLAAHFRGLGACSGRPANETDRLAAAFELRLPYPSHERIDLRRTIEEAGLTPNAVVIFQRGEGDTPLGS